MPKLATGRNPGRDPRLHRGVRRPPAERAEQEGDADRAAVAGARMRTEGVEEVVASCTSGPSPVSAMICVSRVPVIPSTLGAAA